MKTKNILFSLFAAGFLSYNCQEARAPTMQSLSAQEKDQITNIEVTRKLHEQERKITELLQKYPTLNYADASMLFQNNGTYEIKKYGFDKIGSHKSSNLMNIADLLTDKNLQKSLTWLNYDQLPDEVIYPTLRKIFDENKLVLTTQFQLDTNSFLQFPEPVLLAKYYLQISDWTKKWNPDKTDSQIHLLEDIAFSVMLQESFATKQGVLKNGEMIPDAKYLQKKDLGLFQISPEARNSLRKKTEFKNLKDIDFISPEISIKAGTYWLSQCMREANQDLLIGIACYNAGITDSINQSPRSVAYREMVIDRMIDYVVEGKSKTLNYSISRAKLARLSK